MIAALFVVQGLRTVVGIASWPASELVTSVANWSMDRGWPYATRLSAFGWGGPASYQLVLLGFSLLSIATGLAMAWHFAQQASRASQK